MFRNPIIVIMIVLGLAGMACGMISRTERISEAAETSGEQIFQRSGCSGCHGGVVGIAPSLNGLYGEQVSLESGETVIADEDYLQESILNPNAKVVRGYQPVMPDFQGQLTEGQLEALVEYIVSLGD